MSRNILLIVSSMHSGGAERTAANLVNAWAARGDKVTLLVTFSGRGSCFYPLDDRVNLVFLDDLIASRNRRKPGKIRRLLALRQFLRQHSNDAILSFLTNVNVATLIAALFLPIRITVAEHIYPPQIPLGLLWERLRLYTYPLAHRVVMLTAEGQTWLERCIPSAVGTVIPNPVQYPLPSMEPTLPLDQIIAKDRKLLLAVGRLDPQKGFDFLLRAFARLAPDHPDWVLVIIGEGRDRQKLERQREEAGLTHRILLPGKAGNIGEWYSRADLYVMSSRFEGFPNTLVEAMSYGCVAVSFDCDTGPRDIIRNELNGLLVRPTGDDEALASALQRLMISEDARGLMGKMAVEVRDRYSMETILEMWDNVFAATPANEDQNS